MNNRQKWHAIAQGKRPDDYTNHFLSHFGFYSDNSLPPPQYDNTQHIPYNAKSLGTDY